jgi:transposase InsO family protein
MTELQHIAELGAQDRPDHDNAACESFIKTLKYEEVYRTEYRDLADAYAQIGEFLERVYNQKRLRSATRLSASGRVRAERRERFMRWLRAELSLGAPPPNARELSHFGQNDRAEAASAASDHSGC